MGEIRKFRGRKSKEDFDDYEEDNTGKQDFEHRIHRHRLRRFYVAAIVCVIIVAVIVICILSAESKIYTSVKVTEEISWSDNSGLDILQIGNNLLTYSKDGAVCSSLGGKALWNKTFEMQNPLVKVRGEYAAIGDYNGTTIYVVNSDGVLGEIDTTLPIKAVDVSGKGTVIAVVDDNPVTWIYLYSKEGKLLLYAKTSMSDYGYPVDVTLSDDSGMLAVSYVYTDGGDVASRVAFYNLQDVGDNYQDNLVSAFSYVDAVVPMIRFLDSENSFAVADNRFMLYSGQQIPTTTKEILLIENVRNVVYGNGYVGLIYLNTDGNGKYRMEVYDVKGNQVGKYFFDRDYSDILMCNEMIYIYDAGGLEIYNMKGTLKFSGEFGMSVSCLIPGESRDHLTLVGKTKIQSVILK